MDSLTQIVLGAACGEAILGKKIGNKALLFGAIGGTIPDLDVFVGSLIYNNKIDAMLFHRGFMHSILFSILASLLLGWLTFKRYNSGKRLHTTTQRDWLWLWFLSLFTHPILDCFTPYGTQLFAPFSNYRVAFNNIAVADPFYTLPFLISMIVLMFFKRQSIRRKFWLKLGVGISSVYMLFTLGNKLYIDNVFRKSLKNSNISYARFSTQPSILNNILWFGIAESKTNYYVAFYSLLDSKPYFLNFEELPKSRVPELETQNDLKRLAWFSNYYYNTFKLAENSFSYFDLRYPVLNDNDSSTPIFYFNLFKDEKRLNMKSFEPNTGDFNKAIKLLWERLKGR